MNRSYTEGGKTEYLAYLIEEERNTLKMVKLVVSGVMAR